MGSIFPEFSSCKNQVSGKKKTLITPSLSPPCPAGVGNLCGRLPRCSPLGAHAAPAAFLLHSQAICWPSRARRMKWEGKLRAVTQFPLLLSEVDFDASAHTGAAHGWGLEELARGRHRASLANSMHAACAAPPAFWGHAPNPIKPPCAPQHLARGIFPPAVLQNRLLGVSPVRTSSCPKPENKRAGLFPGKPEPGLGVWSWGRKGSRLAGALGEGCCAPTRPWKSRLVLQGAGRESAAQPCPRHR